jgi:putative redox protein
MDIQVSFPGGKRVDAQIGEFLVETDQPTDLGGQGAAPAPYDLFLASIATCAGIYVLGFCQARGISTEGLTIVQRNDIDPGTKLLRAARIELRLPMDFPEKYRTAILRAAEGCKVKKTIAAAPVFQVIVTDSDASSGATRREELPCVSE